MTQKKQSGDPHDLSEDSFRQISESLPYGVVFQDVTGQIIFANLAASDLLGLTIEQLTGRTTFDQRWRSIHEDESDFPGDEHPTMVAIRTGKAVHNVIMGISNQVNKNTVVWINIHAIPLFRPGKKAHQVYAVFEDVSEKKQAERALKKSKEHYRLLFEHMQEGAIFCQMIFDGRRKPVDWLFLMANQAYYQFSGLEDVVGKTMLEVRPEIPAAHPELLEIYGRVAVTGISEKFEMFLKPPHIWIRVSTFQPIPGHFVVIIDNITDRKLAQEALIKQNEQLSALTTRIQRVTEEEKRRIARQVHDDLGQLLTALKMEADFLAHKIAHPIERSDPAQLAEKVAEISLNLGQGIQLVRTISQELHPAILDDLGLVSAIRWQLKHFSERTGVAGQFQDFSGIAKFSRDHSIELFRILQEALTNTTRHAQATMVDVVLMKARQALIMEIADNGCGLVIENIDLTKSLGIISMRERARSLGGSLQILGNPGTGTKILVEIPLRKVKHGSYPDR